MHKLIILVTLFLVGAKAQNMDPVPRSEVLLLKHTSKLENYNWGPIYNSSILGSICGFSKREMCHAKSFAERYTTQIRNLRNGMQLPLDADYPAMIQSVWASKNESMSVDDVWKTLMSYLKLQRSLVDLQEFLGKSSSNSRTTVFRGSVYPHLAATAANFSVFHKVQAFQEGLKIAGDELVLKIQSNRIKTILKKAFEPFREQLLSVQLEMTQPQVDTENMEKLRVRQMFSLARIFDVIKMNLNTYSLGELTVLETIDSYESLPAHFYLYAFFLKENQQRVIQNLDPYHLELMFQLVLLADVVRYAVEDQNFEVEPTELTKESQELVKLIQKEISMTVSAYQKVVEMGVVQ